MNLLRRITRRLLVRLIRLPLRSRRVAFLGAAAVSLALVAAALNVNQFRGGASLLNTEGGRPRAGNEPASTAEYWRGQQSYDAHLVWDAYSDRLTQAVEQRGLTVDDYQRQLDRGRQAGSKIEQVNYVGGYPVSNGSMQFYVVFRSEPSQTRAVPIPYVFTLDSSGKIERVE